MSDNATLVERLTYDEPSSGLCEEAAARIAELEASLGEATGRIETDGRLITELGAEVALLNAKCREWEAQYWEAQEEFTADLEDSTLSVGEAYAYRSESHGPGKKS